MLLTKCPDCAYGLYATNTEKRERLLLVKLNTVTHHGGLVQSRLQDEELLAFSNKPLTSEWPLIEATCCGVVPFLSALSLSALAASNRRTTSKWPSSAATCSGVVPRLVAMSLSALASSSRQMISDWSTVGNALEAAKSGVSPFSLA